jgi:glycosyltransferase involved in cell wall biosynthesis
MKKLAVLLPTYNAAPYLNESIDSILNQTFSDFDLYVYDDCSTDTTESVVLKYTDSRVFYRKNVTNLGIARTLNLGLEALLPHYKYIARMDADDWSYPERFKKQLEYLEQNKEVVLCGTQGYWLKNINQNPISGWGYPKRHEYIRLYLLFGATFHHQTIIFRSQFIVENNLKYDENITTCEDWDLWTRIVIKGKIVNLPDFLIKCRILPFSNHHSPLNQGKHLQERSKIISNYWSSFNIELSPQQIFDFYYNENVVSKKQFIRDCKILIRAFNQLYIDTIDSLNPDDKRIFAYLLVRKIVRYWSHSKVSRIDPLVWWTIIKEVNFISKVKLTKSLI